MKCTDIGANIYRRTVFNVGKLDSSNTLLSDVMYRIECMICYYINFGCIPRWAHNTHVIKHADHESHLTDKIEAMSKKSDIY